MVPRFQIIDGMCLGLHCKMYFLLQFVVIKEVTVTVLGHPVA